MCRSLRGRPVVRKGRARNMLPSVTEEADMTTKKIQKELMELEKRYWQAIKDKDADAAMRLTDTQCIVAGAQGVSSIDSKSLAAMMQRASYTLDDFELKDDAQVRMLGEDVAILAYKVHEELTV